MKKRGIEGRYVDVARELLALAIHDGNDRRAGTAFVALGCVIDNARRAGVGYRGVLPVTLAVKP